MYLEATDLSLTPEQIAELKKGATKFSYRKLMNLIKKELPDVYDGMFLNVPNLDSKEVLETPTHFIFTRLNTEVFLRKQPIF